MHENNYSTETICGQKDCNNVEKDAKIPMSQYTEELEILIKLEVDKNEAIPDKQLINIDGPKIYLSNLL